ncbi:4328_t:CDS:2 [Dentiscutata erythropus]|uniref:4328_t:CDS:1 n=1 Tax=Dentiscutata erythropus TaxID=1348616 RepID=A0A9N9GB80_9GLOM|nr:4328_t:CDS:2 [Dentiscutata erythropus]
MVYLDSPGNQKRVNSISKFVEELYEYLKQKARNNPYITQDTEFTKILLDGCAITNPTPTNSPKNPLSNLSSTSSEHIEEILSSFIEENIKELSGSKNNWTMPKNSDYELEQ